MTERLQRRAILGLAFGAGLAPGYATKAGGEPIKAFHLCMIVPSRPLPGTRAFEGQLRQFGYEEGRNLHLDFLQLFGADIDRVAEMAAELVGRGVDAILAGGPEIALKSAMAATRTLPLSWSRSITIRWRGVMSTASLVPEAMSPAFSFSRSS